MAQADRVWRASHDGRWGVFAAHAFGEGELVERCYCLPLDLPTTDASRFGPWLFEVPGGPVLLALGWGSLYNSLSVAHLSANLDWEHETCLDDAGEARHFVIMRALCAIPEGDELCVRRSSRNPVVDIVNCALRILRDELRIPLPDRAEYSNDRADVPGGVLNHCLDAGIETRFSPLHGHGVFALRPFKKNEIVEIVPNLYVAEEVLRESLSDYTFDAASIDERVSRLALGLGSVYNHSEFANLKYRPARAGGVGDGVGKTGLAQQFCSCYVASCDIAAGEELLISYGMAWWKSRGKTTANYKDGGTYFGGLCPDTRRRHGYGTYCFRSGAVYAGQWLNGQTHGHGKYKFENGAVFEGSYLLGKKQGWGSYTWKSGSVEVSEYDGGKCISDGIRWDASGGRAWRIPKSARFDKAVEISLQDAAHAVPVAPSRRVDELRSEPLINAPHSSESALSFLNSMD